MHCKCLRGLKLIESKLNDILPSGSGINGAWEFTYHTGWVIQCHNFYQTMNDAGMYDGYAYFKVCINIIDKSFTLQFRNGRSHYLNSKYQLRDYLDDTLYHALHEGGVIE